MKELRFSLDFNSPAFLSSTPRGTKSIAVQGAPVAPPPYFPADPRGVRIPSLRGVLEFWYRALLGGTPSAEVFQQQARTFGSADGGQGLSIRPLGMPRFDSGILDFDQRDEDPFPYLYLGYGPLQLLRGPHGRQVATSYHKKQARDAIYEGIDRRSRFQFMARGTPSQIEALKRALVLLHLFGGLGSRSRRGWGSVEVEAKEAGIAPPPATAGLAEWLQTALANAWKAEAYPPGHGQPEFSALSPDARIYVTRVLEGDYRTVLQEFFRRLRDVRSYRDRRPLAVADHTLETGDLNLPSDRSITAVPARLAFGMPFQPGHGDQWVMKYQGRLPGPDWREGKVVTRRASPLFLKVLRLGAQRHAGVALFLPARFFGDPRLRVGAEHKDQTQSFPGYGAVETLLSSSGWTRVPLP